MICHRHYDYYFYHSSSKVNDAGKITPDSADKVPIYFHVMYSFKKAG